MKFRDVNEVTCGVARAFWPGGTHEWRSPTRWFGFGTNLSSSFFDHGSILTRVGGQGRSYGAGGPYPPKSGGCGWIWVGGAGGYQNLSCDGVCHLGSILFHESI